MIKEPIYQGRLQSDLDFAGFNPVNLTGWPPSGGGGGGAITPLVNGQSYIQVTFAVVQPDASWKFTQLLVVNTTDADPLNIMVATLSRKTATGFRLQLSGAPDSANYYLHWNFTGTGGGSAVGGGYTMVDTAVGGDTTRVIVPTVRVAQTAVVYCHGLGETTHSLAIGVDISPYDVTRDFDPVGDIKHLYMMGALNAGYLLAAGDFGGYLWSNATAQAKVEALVGNLVANYGVTKVVLWSMSAGGAIGLLKVTQGFSGVTVPGWFGIYPVVDLNVAHGNALLTASINAAFPAYSTDAAGRDPILLPATAYNGLRLRCCGSLADTAVPVASHGQALVTLTTGHAIETTCILTSGDHGDASNFTQALANDFVAFLNRCF
jgi:hypothetical protein